MDIKLNLINRSNDANNSQIVIFQKNAAADEREPAVAWQVIQNLGPGENHPFKYSIDTAISVGDSWGNYSPRLAAQNGQLFSMARTSSGDTLSLHGPATSPDEIECRNDLQQGAISVGLYKSGKLLLQKRSVAPGQQAVFVLQPKLFIEVVSQMEEGEFMDSAIMSNINTELSLLGIASADIIMSGGGPGPTSTPFRFTLENVVMA